MNRKSGLGKGINALISDDAIHKIETNINAEGELVQDIDVNLIIPNKDQPRKHFDQEKIASLAESISENGLIQPIVLKRKGGFYEIIAGERRWRATKHLGLKKIKSIIKDVDEVTIAQLALIENIQREDLNVIEEANAYKRLIEEYQVTQEKLSKIVGKSRSHLTNTMRLLKLDDYIQKSIIDDVITHGHGRALLSCDNDKQRAFAFEKIISEGLSVRKTEELTKNIEKVMTMNRQGAKVAFKSLEVQDLENKLTQFFGTKVTIQDKSNKGKVILDYYSHDDLNRIIDLIHSK